MSRRHRITISVAHPDVSVRQPRRLPYGTGKGPAVTTRFVTPAAPWSVDRSAQRKLVFLAAALFALLAFSSVTFAQGEKTTTGEPPAAKSDEPRESAIPKILEKVPEEVKYVFIGAFVIASILTVWFSIERLVVLRRARVIPRAFVDRFLEHLRHGRIDRNEALKLCEENGSPVADIFSHGVRKWGKPSVEVEQAIIDGGERQISQLKRHLRVLNGVATVTPLIGLLGTVVGMIKSFLAIEAAGASAAGGDAKLQLAVGIAMALLTTAAGLGIAIPALILYMYLAGRVDTLVMDMDQLGQDVVNLISAEGLAEAASRPKTSPKSTGNPPVPKSLKKKSGPEAKSKASV